MRAAKLQSIRIKDEQAKLLTGATQDLSVHQAYITQPRVRNPPRKGSPIQPGTISSVTKASQTDCVY